jgi:tetratricopeptide (TPR) repeat protein
MAELLGEVGGNAINVAFARAQAYVLSGKPEAAVDVLDTLLESHPEDHQRIFNSAGELFAQQRDPAEYVQYMRMLTDAYPRDRHAYFALSYLANRARDGDTLTYAITRALELSPDWEEAAVVRYVQLVQLNEFESARQFAEDFLAQNPDALDLAERHARLLAARGEMESARVHFQRILRQRPDDAPNLLAAALVDMQLEKWSSARRLLLRLLKLDPSNDEIRMHLGLVAASRERYDDAIDWYRDVEHEAFLFRAQLRIVSVLRTRDGPQAALDYLKELIPVTIDEEVELLLTQEQILRQMNRLGEAHALIDGAVREIPDNSDLLYARGLLAAELKILPQHEADIRRVIELDPDNAHAYNALGYTLADQTDRYHEALELITRALELAPEDPFILDSMGWVQYRLGHYQAATDYLRKALALRDDAEIAAHLGEVLWETGGKEEARKIWNEALQDYPENPTLVETLNRLDPR